MNRAVLPPKLHPAVHVVLAALIGVGGLSGLVALGLWRDRMEAQRCELQSVTRNPGLSGGGEILDISSSGASDSSPEKGWSHYDGCNWTACDARGNCSMTLVSCTRESQWTVTP